MFFVFDGVDGSGKSTQLKLFGDRLAAQGHTIQFCTDPGSTELGMRIRNLLLHEKELRIDMRSELLMFMAARAQLVSQTIVPALEEGNTVICDRYSFSTVVYQGYAGGLDPEEIWQVNEVATGGVQPDLTFIFDLDVDKSMQRLGKSLDRVESRGSGYFEKLRAGFLTEAQRWPTGVEVIDADGDVELVQKRVWDVAHSKITG